MLGHELLDQSMITIIQKSSMNPPTVDKNISVELDEGDIMVELVRFVVLLVYGHLDWAEVLWWRGTVAELVAVLLTPQVVLSHSHPGADNTLQPGVGGVRGFALRHLLLLLHFYHSRFPLSYPL